MTTTDANTLVDLAIEESTHAGTVTIDTNEDAGGLIALELLARCEDFSGRTYWGVERGYEWQVRLIGGRMD